MKRCSGIVFAVLFSWACDDGGSAADAAAGTGGTDASTAGADAGADDAGSAAVIPFDCDVFAAENCDPACACVDGPACAFNGGEGGGASRFETRDECLDFFRPTCEFVVEAGGSEALEAQYVDCREDLLNAECAGEGQMRGVVQPDSCKSEQG